jgi:hypothetical protein
MRLIGLLIFAAVLATGLGFAIPGYAQSDDSASSGSAMQQLQDAVQDGQEAVAAPTDEKAKEESNETFDTPHDSDGD